MSNFDKCINQALKEQVISEETAQEIKDIYDGNAQEALDQALQSTQRKKYLTALNKFKQREALKIAESHPRGLRQGIFAMLTKDVQGGIGIQNVEYRANAITGIMHSKFTDAMDAMRTRRFGFTQDKNLIDDVVREVFGKSTGNSKASKFAKQWDEIAEELRLWHNKAGGDIPKLKDWGLPQTHNMFKIRNAGVEEWKSFVKPLVKDLDDETLEYVYETITTGGLNKLNPLDSPPKGVSKMKANRRQEHRFLKFKDGDSWLQYQKQFGSTDAFVTMNDHIRNMANDISLMEIMGPNPDATFDVLLTSAKKENENIMGIESAYSVVSGKVDQNMAVSDLGNIAQASSGTLRNIHVASKLGSATLSALSDLGILAITAGFNKMPIMKTINTGLKALFDEGKIKQGVRAGLVADAWIGDVAGNSRFSEVSGYGMTQKWSEAVMRASGLVRWTEAHRKAFGLEMSGFIGDQVGKSYKDLDKGVINLFKRYGIDENDWKIVSKYKTQEGNILDTQAMAKGGDTQTAVKINSAILSETDYAVLVPDARTRAITTAGQPRGTIIGEGARLITQFKSFPISMLLTHFSRMMYQNNSFGSRVAYGAGMFTTLTTLGYVAMTAKDLVSGKEPKDLEKPATWAASAMQGGALGLFGDFAFSDQTRYGNSFMATLQGPTVSMAEDISRITIGNLQEFMKGKETKAAGELSSTALNYIPGQSLWYGRLLFQRAVKDQIAQELDPDYRKKIRRQQKQMKKEFNQDYWWKP